LHMAQLIPLPLTVFWFRIIHIGLTFWYRFTRVVLYKGALNVCVVCVVCVCVRACVGVGVCVCVYKQKLINLSINPFICLSLGQSVGL